MEKKKVKKIKVLAEKYGFTVREGKDIDSLDYVVLQAKNTDGNEIDWIRYYTTGKIKLLGNTDQCNIWFYNTRKDFTPKKIAEFVEELNRVFDLDENSFTIEELIDPEDWQALANVRDAYEDDRYLMNNSH